jgi:DNA-binding beta-propeller fold protein YncE
MMIILMRVEIEESSVRRVFVMLAAVVAMRPVSSRGQQAGPYKVLQIAKVGGEGGFDYVYADDALRRLYVPRLGPAGKITVFDLDTLKPVGEIANASAHGVAVDAKSEHGFGSSKPVVMWDAKTLATIKTIEVQGGPDGILGDPYNGRVYVFSHNAPNATVIDAKDGTAVGTIDLGGAPEQGVSDGKGHLYIDLEDKGSIAVVNAKTMKVTATYDLQGKGATCAGLAMDVKNNILFATCRDPQTMVILNAGDGKILETLPIGAGTDGAVFNPKTMEAFSSQGDGTLTIVKENSPTSFVVEQTLRTMTRAKTLTLDRKANRLVLIAAEFTPAPAPAPGERPSRGQMVPDTFSILVVGK